MSTMDYIKLIISLLMAVFSILNSMGFAPLPDLDVETERPIYETISDGKNSNYNSDSIDIRDSLSTLNDDERQIINYRYFQDLTQSETAKALGVDISDTSVLNSENASASDSTAASTSASASAAASEAASTEASQAALDTAPQGQEDILDKKTSPLKGADLEINRIPSLLKMIKEIN